MLLEIEKIKKKFRSLWISRISAASKSFGLSYSKLIHILKDKNIILNRKILSDIACQDNSTFEKIVKKLSAKKF